MPMQHARQRLCGNCLSAVTGLYCAHCGQKQKSAVRHVGQLTGEFLNDVLNLDEVSGHCLVAMSMPVLTNQLKMLLSVSFVKKQ